MEQRLLLLPFEDGLEKELRLQRLRQLVAYVLVTGVRLAEPILQQLLLPLHDENDEQAVVAEWQSVGNLLLLLHKLLVVQLQQQLRPRRSPYELSKYPPSVEVL
jgi:hypothetical protein